MRDLLHQPCFLQYRVLKIFHLTPLKEDNFNNHRSKAMHQLVSKFFSSLVLLNVRNSCGDFSSNLQSFPVRSKLPQRAALLHIQGDFFLAISPHFRRQIWGKNIKSTSGPFNREFDRSSEWLQVILLLQLKMGKGQWDISPCVSIIVAHYFLLQTSPLFLSPNLAPGFTPCGFVSDFEDCLDFLEKILWRESAVWFGASILVNECIFCEQCLRFRI